MMRKNNYTIHTLSAKMAATSLIAAFAAFTFAGCSQDNTAGVISETESGQTASITLTLEQSAGDTYTSARVMLTSTKDDRTTLLTTAEPDSNNQVTFKNVPLQDFSIIATALSENNETITSIITKESLNEIGVFNDSGLTIKQIKTTLKEPATLQVSSSIADFEIGDSLCISRTLSCGIYDETAKESGFIQIEGIPAYSLSGNYIDYQQIEIIRNGDATIDSVYWRIQPGDTLVASKEGTHTLLDTLSYTLPESSLLDSLSDKALDSLIVPFKKASGIALETFLGSDFRELAQYTVKAGGTADSTLSWITIPPSDSTVQIYRANSGIYSPNKQAESRIRYGSFGQESDDTLHNELFKDSSFAFSFWIEQDSSADMILSAIQDSVGLEIRRCETDAKSICTKIYNGIDTAATDTLEFGKSKILDGNRHHVALVIHKKHLTIAIDGETVRDTDLKLDKAFYNLKKIEISTPMTQVLHFSFGEFIRKKEDRNWNRLKAWLKAFYELQK